MQRGGSFEVGSYWLKVIRVSRWEGWGMVEWRKDWGIEKVEL